MSKTAKKNKKSKGKYGKSDKLYEENYEKTDDLYGIVAQFKKGYNNA